MEFFKLNMTESDICKYARNIMDFENSQFQIYLVSEIILKCYEGIDGAIDWRCNIQSESWYQKLIKFVENFTVNGNIEINSFFNFEGEEYDMRDCTCLGEVTYMFSKEADIFRYSYNCFNYILGDSDYCSFLLLTYFEYITDNDMECLPELTSDFEIWSCIY
eukprot:421140_1